MVQHRQVLKPNRFLKQLGLYVHEVERRHPDLLLLKHIPEHAGDSVHIDEEYKDSVEDLHLSFDLLRLVQVGDHLRDSAHTHDLEHAQDAHHSAQHLVQVWIVLGSSFNNRSKNDGQS